MIAYEAAVQVERYTMLFHREWWACVEGCGDLEFAGRRYVKVADVEFCGFQGQEMLGYLAFSRIRGMIGARYKLSLVTEDLLVGHHLRDVLEGYVRVRGYRVSHTQAAYNVWLYNESRIPQQRMNVAFEGVINHGTEESPVLEYRWGSS